MFVIPTNDIAIVSGEFWEYAVSNPAEKYKIWEGVKFEIPKKFKKYQLVEAENNHGSEAIFPIKDGKLRITIVKKQ